MRIIKGDIKTTTKGKVKTERKIPQDKTKYDEKRQVDTFRKRNGGKNQ